MLWFRIDSQFTNLLMLAKNIKKIKGKVNEWIIEWKINKFPTLETHLVKIPTEVVSQSDQTCLVKPKGLAWDIMLWNTDR